ncbi:MAG: hypothetical protein PSU94_00855 [Lacunisphaera sp.]|nr:hypothetical protein [Lacunisphaera sp.]
MLPDALRQPSARLVCLCTLTVVLLFALYTNHVWEDYYITYRSSKNLATGHGLVFNEGDKLHTFTSPLGVLLPAVACLLTANTSDPAALWIFRLMCMAALAGAAVLLRGVAQRLHYARVASFFLVALLLTDAKIVDFTINGMETAFMLLFLAYALWAQVSPGPRQARHLGAAWAGLMWTRPDSFVYIGLVAAGFWLFHDARQQDTTRPKLLGLYLRAGLVTTALYLPWLVFAHGYYGTAVPHTITAKSGIGDPRTVAGFLKKAVLLPFTPADDSNTLAHTFLPSYFMIGGWPPALTIVARAIGVLCSLAWLLPRQRTETRAASFAFLGGHAYLSYFPYFPFPWYLPSTTLLAFVTLSGLANQAAGIASPAARRLISRGLVLPVLTGLLAMAAWITVQAAREQRAQQTYIENGTRRKIGEWLHDHARPGDTVFLEPLGYIGFFSGLKTFDFPGMSSREMVEARAKVTNDWGALIHYLQPDWLVLRPHELARLKERHTDLLTRVYLPVQSFSTLEAVQGLEVYGKPFLAHDASFVVLKLDRKMTYRGTVEEVTSLSPASHLPVEGKEAILVHAPSRMVLHSSIHTATLEVSYGFLPGAYTGEGDLTDGATFQIEWQGDGKSVLLLDKVLDPVTYPDHRGLQFFRGDVPATKDRNARLIFTIQPGATLTKDWTVWTQPEQYAAP